MSVMRRTWISGRLVQGSGEDAQGNPPGVYLEDTGGRLFGTGTNGPTVNLNSGTFDFEIDFGTGQGFQNFLTYCLQPEVDLPPNITTTSGATYEIEPLSNFASLTAAEITELEVLWANAFDLVVDETDAGMKQDLAAAFQFYVWELAAPDPTFNPLIGTVRLSDTFGLNGRANNIITAWRANFTGGIWTEQEDLMMLASDEGQNLIFPTPGATTLLAFAGVGLSRRRRPQTA